MGPHRSLCVPMDSNGRSLCIPAESNVCLWVFVGPYAFSLILMSVCGSS